MGMSGWKVSQLHNFFHRIQYGMMLDIMAFSPRALENILNNRTSVFLEGT